MSSACSGTSLSGSPVVILIWVAVHTLDHAQQGPSLRIQNPFLFNRPHVLDQVSSVLVGIQVSSFRDKLQGLVDLAPEISQGSFVDGVDVALQ